VYSSFDISISYDLVKWQNLNENIYTLFNWHLVIYMHISALIYSFAEYFDSVHNDHVLFDVFTIDLLYFRLFKY
jgi:hypothetical protein